MISILRFLIIGVFLVSVAGSARADFIIEINFSGNTAFQSFFDDAAAVWESKLSGYQDGNIVNRSSGSSYQIGEVIDRLIIDASIEFIDGSGGILGSAGPTEIVIDSAGFTLASDGLMRFDSADAQDLVDDGLFDDVVLHEMAHVMGFGTLWTDNDVYTNGTGEFLGAEATRLWQEEFGQSGTPNVELGGGGGTANGHWNEVDGGAGLTGITDGEGRDMRDELMTGWLNPNDPFISEMTVGSFVDIGFTAVPEPGTSILLMVGMAAFAASRRRR